MIFPTENLEPLLAIIGKVKSMNFNINTQYKMLKLNKVAREEYLIMYQQRQFIFDNYAERNENGDFILKEDGAIKIKEDCLEECAQKIKEINERQITFPDIYFSLDELEPLGLTLEELFVLEPLIK